MKVVGQLSPEETRAVIQLFGQAIEDPKIREKHNEALKSIARRFNVVWTDMEITPAGQVLCKSCDETISEEDVSVEE